MKSGLKRSLIRFRVALGIVAAALSIWAIVRNVALSEQLDTIARIKRAGGSVFRGPDSGSGGFPERLECLFHDIPYGVAFHNRSTTDKELDVLDGFTWLRDLRVSFTKVTGARIGLLAKFPRLEVLSIAGSNVVDEDLASLSEFPQLRVLWLGEEQCSQDGLEHVANIATLRELSLVGNNCQHRLWDSDSNNIEASISSILSIVRLHSLHCPKQPLPSSP